MPKAFEFHFNHPLPDTTDTLTNVLFINEEPEDGDVLQVEPKTAAGVSMTLKVVTDKEVSKTNHHFKLTFRPGTLALPGDVTVESSQAAQWGLRSETETGALIRSGEQYALGDVHLYVLYKGDTALTLGSGKSLVLGLNKVGAAAGKGTRPTLVQLTLPRSEAYVQLSGPADDYNLVENTDLGLISVRGPSVPPSLEAGFSSSDIVLNDGDTQNHLVLRIVNTGPVPIVLSSGTGSNAEGASRFTLRLESSTNAADGWALGTAAQVASVLIPGKPDSSTTDPNWPGHSRWALAGPNSAGEWTLTPKSGNTSLEPGAALEVPLSKVVTGHATGRTALLVRYTGLTGYSDGERVAFIQKYPLKFVGQKLGLGTASPSAKLTVETAANEVGVTHTDGSVSLSLRLNGTGAANTRTAGIGTQTNHDLLLFTNNAVSSPLMTLKTDGKVGIGTTTPATHLQLKTATKQHGFSHTDGSRTLSTWVDDSGASLGTTSSHPLRFFTASSSAQMTLTTAGDLGIGTSSPHTRLHVQTPTLDYGITHTDGTRKFCTFISQTAVTLGTRSQHPLRLFAGDKDVLTLTTNGRLGIGTENPEYPVQVRTGSSSYGISHTDGTHSLSTYVSDKGGWLGTTTNHDLNFFTNQGSANLTLKTNGKLLSKGQPLFKCTSISIASGKNDVCLGNGYRSADWQAVVAGFKLDAKDDPGDKAVDMACYPKIYDGHWHIYVDSQYGHNSWRVHVLFINQALLEGSYSY